MGKPKVYKQSDLGKKKRRKVTVMESAMLRTLTQVGKLKVRDIIKDRKRFPGFKDIPKSTLYRHAKKSQDGSAPFDRLKINPGRPKKMTKGDMRLVRRNIGQMRKDLGTFTSVELQESCGMKDIISNSGFRKYLHKAGYRYRRTRKKGLLSYGDLVRRIRFVRKVKKNFKS